jgi:Fructose-1-6-bisphosphatase, C-terminal domain
MVAPHLLNLHLARTLLCCTARYIGSMVGDLHRTLLYGGLFGYPAGALLFVCCPVLCRLALMYCHFLHCLVCFAMSNSPCSFLLFHSAISLTFSGSHCFPFLHPTLYPCPSVPIDSKRPRGKLRLLNEVSPLSFLVEQVRP